ncbi:MAG: response regulator [Patescibacteria group bacterium]|nr:response regulator [Patescibacteria group bacterium]MDE1944231.1 response regulator [Patescibacteria group bacterium]MDE1945164.1 response regulator [Patescibacteria group bacterium]MDE2057809.1 response regulator [Patescibacteria group bacterium]
MADAPEKQGAILLVEDDDFLRDILAGELAKEGFAVAVAPDGEKALAAASAHVPDLILLDLVLPGMSGFELIAKLRQQEATAKVPFMVLSNSAERENKQESVSLGAVGYLVKAESTPPEIVDAIKAWFAAR